MTKIKPLMSLSEVSDYLGVPRSTLYRWRTHREGPPSRRVGRYVRYRSDDVEDWIEDRPEWPR